MNPQYPNQTPTELKTDNIKNPIASMQPGERNICEITRHPIGMLGTYIMSGFVLIVVALLAFVVAPTVVTSYSRSETTGIGAVIFLIVAVFTMGFVFIANKVYWGNRWILTSDSLTQVTQKSLFDKQSSQLSLGNLEDVTAERNGVLAHMFKYGVLRVETAGEKARFRFLYCPNPEFYAQQVLQAREAFEIAIHQVGGVNQGTYPTAQQAQPYPAAGSPTPPAQAPLQSPVPPPPGYSNPDPDPGVNVGTQL